MKRGLIVSGLAILMVYLFGCQSDGPHGPLMVSQDNPRYFADQDGKTVYLTGSHTWNNRVDMTTMKGQDSFDYESYLAFLESHNHNFFRLWAWDLLTWNTSANREKNGRILHVYPQPWLRTGPGLALDGEPRFDLTAYNPEYFQRLRERVRIAAEHDMYVAVMLFEGWGIQFSPEAYQNHPFHPANNIQHLTISGADSARLEIYTLQHADITRLQEGYVLKVIETVNEFDNVLYEISNENQPGSTEWQYHMINFVKQTESVMGRAHPVGMTFQYRGGSNQALFDSPADWISPNGEGGYNEDPPAATGSKVIITDTDHLWGIGGNRQWVWKSFFRGLNPIFMDPYNGKVLERGSGTDWAEEVRLALGYTRQIAGRADLARFVPAGELSSSGFCLADHGREYMVYVPEGQPVTLDLEHVSGRFVSSWFSAVDGTERSGREIEGGSQVTLSSPFKEGDAMVWLK
jgi:hypothetical protein